MLIRNGGKAVGPYTPDEVRAYLAAGHLTPETPAWTEGLIDWSTTAAVLSSLEERPPATHPPEFTNVESRSLIPDGVRGFSWGALLTGAIWAIRHQVWVGLLTIIPGLGQIILFWLGFNGRELAWRKGHWKSVAEFNRVQRRWAWYGVVFSVLLILGLLWLKQTGRLPAVGQRTPVEGAAPEHGEQPQQPDQPAQPQKKGELQLPMERTAFHKAFQGASVVDVMAQLGPPPGQREVQKGVLVLAYSGITYQSGSKRPDDGVLLYTVKGTVQAIQFVKDVKK